MLSFSGKAQNYFHTEEEIQCIDNNKRELKIAVVNGTAKQKFIYRLLF